MSALAMPAKLIMRPSTHDWADKHRAVLAAADDVLAVQRVRHRPHGSRVPRQRALLPMDQTQRSEHSTQQQTIGRSQTRTLTSLPVLLSQILTVSS